MIVTDKVYSKCDSRFTIHAHTQYICETPYAFTLLYPILSLSNFIKTTLTWRLRADVHPANGTRKKFNFRERNTATMVFCFLLNLIILILRVIQYIDI